MAYPGVPAPKDNAHYGNDLDLIRMAVREHDLGHLTEEQAMLRIGIVLNIQPPSVDCVKWAMDSLGGSGA